MQRFVGGVAQLAEVEPKVLDKVDWDVAVELLAEYDQVEPKILLSSTKVNKKRTEREEVQKRVAEAEAGQAEGDMVKAQADGETQLRAV